MYDECMRNGGRGYELQNLPGPVEVILGGVKGSQVGGTVVSCHRGVGGGGKKRRIGRSRHYDTTHQSAEDGWRGV